MDCGFERPTWPTHTVKLFGFPGAAPTEGASFPGLPSRPKPLGMDWPRAPPGAGGRCLLEVQPTRWRDTGL